MKKALRVLPAARVDTLSCFEYLREYSGIERAWHFLDCLEHSFERIQTNTADALHRRLAQVQADTLTQLAAVAGKRIQRLFDLLPSHEQTN